MADIFSNRMAIRSNALGGLIEALAKIKQQREQREGELEVNRTLFPQEEQNIGGAIGMMNAPTPAKQPTRDDVLRLLSNSNTAPFAQRIIQGMQLTAPKITQTDPYKSTTETDVFGNTKTIPAQQKPMKASGEFGNFLIANAKLYGNDPDLSRAWDDFQNESMGRVDKKAEITAKYKVPTQRGGKVLTSFTAEDGYKTIVYENPDGSVKNIKSNERVKETEGATLKKQNQQLESLVELTDRISQSAKPEYLGGMVSGLSGAGFGGVMGGVREATGNINDEEVIFRADVSSIKDQLLRARSGAQINEAEYKRLLNELPDVNQPKNVFDARLAGFKQRLTDILSVKGKSGGKENTPTQKPKFEILKVE